MGNYLEKLRKYFKVCHLQTGTCHLPPQGFPDGSVGKESARCAGDTGDTSSTPGPGRCPRGGNGDSLQYSCLEKPKDRRAWWATVHGVTKSRARLSDYAHTSTSTSTATRIKSYAATAADLQQPLKGVQDGD